jgi:hypothetical protein
MIFESSHNNGNTCKQRRFIRMQILRQKRLKPAAVHPKIATRRGCMIFDQLQINF